MKRWYNTSIPEFQSTPPVKAATFISIVTFRLCAISIHAAREGGDLAYGVVITRLTISIHAAREGGDPSSIASFILYMISIHAAREGGDPKPRLRSSCPKSFQSTPPVKAATPSSIASFILYIISIHAAREGGDALDAVGQAKPPCISIHAAREGGDAIAIGATVPPVGFQSTPPVKAATTAF